jgi:hypothetical protein
MENQDSKYWVRIKANIKKLYKEGNITQRYSYENFCNDFIPDEEPLEDNESNKCLCEHDIKYNHEYKHKDNSDYFILGSCCIKKFSKYYQHQRICIDCNKKIKKNKDNRCKECREEEQERLLDEERRRCRGCNYIKKDDKYKYCYYCNQKKKSTYNNN